MDGNGQPANTKLINDVYNYIVSPNDRTQRLLPTACAKLSCVAATTVKMNYTITGLLLDESADKLRVEEDFKKLVLTVYGVAKMRECFDTMMCDRWLLPLRGWRTSTHS